MKKMLVGLGFLSLGIALCYAESFLAQETQKKTRPDHQVKQEILDLMGRIAEYESESIKTKAEIQKAVCTHIRSYVEGSKESFFARATRKDLHRVVSLLKDEYSSLESSIAADRKFLTSLKNPLARQG